jgi:hypothetical protein
MSASGLGLRTVWIAIRATSYAGRTFTDLNNNISQLIGKENVLGGVNKQLIASTVKFAAAGIMTATMAVSLASAIWGIASSSREGAGDFARLNQQMFLTQQAFANTFYEILKSTDVLNLINNILKTLQTNKGLQILTFAALAFGAGMLGLVAVVFLANAAYGAFNILLGLFGLRITMANGYVQLFKGTMFETAVSINSVALALGACMAGLTLFMMLGQAIGNQKGAIVAAAVAITAALLAIFAGETLASSGLNIAPALAGLAVGAGVAAGVMALTSYPIGTRSVQNTGIVGVHKGETIYNPSTNRPLQVGNDLSKNAGGGNTINYISMPVQNLNTKADVDDLQRKTNKTFRKVARSVR